MFTRLRRRKAKPRVTRHPDFPEIDGPSHKEVIDAIEDATAPRWYLEIGSRTGSSLRRRRCNFVAIDPEFRLEALPRSTAQQMHFFQMTSDDFFGSGHLAAMRIVPDLAFVDGMHLFEFVLRDFINLERAMQPGGIVVLHDVCPFAYEITTRDPRAITELGAWTGDVWKVLPILAAHRPDLAVEVLSARRTGLAVVRNLDPSSTRLADAYDEIVDRWRAVELATYGAGAFFGGFELVDPERFISSLRRPLAAGDEPTPRTLNQRADVEP